jgi:hypothetical protein
MPWTGGSPGFNAGSVINAQYLGSEPGGYLRYLLDTGFNVPIDLAIPGLYGVRLYVTNTSISGGSGIPAGNYALDYESTADITFSAPFYVGGAPSNLGTDPFGRPAGWARALVTVRIRPRNVPNTISHVAIQDLTYAIYRVS